jgi:hypothetical protein
MCPMILILAEPTDLSALWLHARLSARATPVRMLTPAQLVYSGSIVHRLSTEASEARFILASGEEVDLAAMSAIINRIAAIPSAHLSGDPSERLYAQTELHAFLLGLLSSLPCPVVNAAAPESLSGAYHGPIEARQMAVQAGFRCSPASCHPGSVFESLSAAPSALNCFVFDGRVVGPVLPQDIRDALVQFAALWGARLVEVGLDSSGGFETATSFVEFRGGGEALVSLLARALGP